MSQEEEDTYYVPPNWRIMVLIITIAIVLWVIFSEIEEDLDIDSFDDIIPKDSILHHQIMELEPCYRVKYLKMLSHAFNDNDDSKSLIRYAKSILIAWVVAICSELIVSGILTKPKAIAKSAVSTLLLSTLSP